MYIYKICIVKGLYKTKSALWYIGLFPVREDFGKRIRGRKCRKGLFPDRGTVNVENVLLEVIGAAKVFPAKGASEGVPASKAAAFVPTFFNVV